jgi:hypothetical protein
MTVIQLLTVCPSIQDLRLLNLSAYSPFIMRLLLLTASAKLLFEICNLYLLLFAVL